VCEYHREIKRGGGSERRKLESFNVTGRTAGGEGKTNANCEVEESYSSTDGKADAGNSDNLADLGGTSFLGQQKIIKAAG